MNDDLDPRLVAALRDVPRASNEVRDQHIAAALDEVVRPTTRPRTRVLGVAAVLVLLLGGVAAFRPSHTRKDSGIAAAQLPDTTLPIKSGVDSSLTTQAPATQVDCQSSLDGSREVGEYDLGGDRRRVNIIDDSMEIIDSRTCDTVAVIAIPRLPTGGTVCIPSLTVGTQMVGTYESPKTTVVVLATAENLTLVGGPRCDVVARFPQPSNK